MPRLHLLELGDQAWLPGSLRVSVLETLELLTDRFDPYGESLHRFADLLARDAPERIVDLCAGAGGPWRRLGPLLAERGCRPQVLLTDAHPNRGAAGVGEGGPLHVDVHSEPVDPREVPASLRGTRTMFNALHHFRPEDVRRILARAAEQGEPIACLEITEKRPGAILTIGLVSLGALLLGPWCRPRRLRRVFWTFALGAIPIVTLFDGLVSCLRSYEPEELLALAREAAPGYEWETGRGPATRLPLRGTWIVGRLRRAGADAG